MVETKEIKCSCGGKVRPQFAVIKGKVRLSLVCKTCNKIVKEKDIK